jgi:hypothetical protein
MISELNRVAIQEERILTVDTRVGRPADVLKQHEDAAHGGDGWAAREGSLLDELGSIWADCGVRSECGTLRAVLMHRPGSEIEQVDDPRAALWFDLLDPPSREHSTTPWPPSIRTTA